MRLFDRRVVLVTGKGGVGKTVVSAAIALAAARSGRNTILCETAGSTRAAALFGVAPQGYRESTYAAGLTGLTITSEAAIEEYLLRVLKFRRLYELVFRNRVMGPFMDAVPGLHDLIQLGKVWDLERTRARGGPAWDLIVVDAPATGHGLTMLSAPRAMMDLTVVGPFHDNAKGIAELIEDPRRTATVLVTLPEDLPVTETLELHERLGPLRPLVAGVVLNEVVPAPVPDRGYYLAQRDALLARANAGGREAVGFVDETLRRVDAQESARRRLSGLGLPLRELPFLYRRDLDTGDLATLAAALDPS